MTKYVIKENDRVYVKGVSSNKRPKNNIGILPSDIDKEDYPYLKATPVYFSDNPEVLSHYEISVDEDAKIADQPFVQADAENDAMFRLRAKRNQLLAESDYTQMADSPLSASDQAAYATYRQELRDLPANVVDVHNPVFPTKPGS